MTARLSPDLETYLRLRADGRDSAISVRLPADLETPVSAYLKLRRAFGAESMGFLLESVERGEMLGRFSFIGAGIQRRLELQPDSIVLHTPAAQARKAIDAADPLGFVREIVGQVQTQLGGAELPPLLGGAVGYLGYDIVRHFERLPAVKPDVLGLPEGLLLLPETIVEFDHALRMIRIVALPPTDAVNAEAAYRAAEASIQQIREALRQPLHINGEAEPVEPSAPPVSNLSQAEYEAAVKRAREYIAAGDIFQVVLSQRLTGETAAEPFQVYRALRLLNPSPYMFFLELGELKLIGSSPEVLVKLSGGEALLNPIAGTRPRAASPEEDATLEAELLASEKERAEHVMLVDLARNDLGRVCETGSVGVPQFMKIDRFSHVMHIVSNVTGRLRQGCDACDLLRATFPAGTVSGAPKIRAMEIIEELEPSRRGPYSGAVGYFGSDGSLDMCIAIRTILMQGQKYHLQAGAGIVADSDPTAEYTETLAKMAALREAIRLAEEGL